MVVLGHVTVHTQRINGEDASEACAGQASVAWKVLETESACGFLAIFILRAHSTPGTAHCPLQDD